MFKALIKSSSIQGKLITLVLTASLASLLLTGLLSFGVARHLLMEGGFERLTTIRNARAVAINNTFEDLSGHVLTLSETRMTIDASKRFNQAFKELPSPNEAQEKAVKMYYDPTFIPKQKETTPGQQSPLDFYPKIAAERYLKANYSITNSLDRSILNDANDGSSWSQVHKDYHPRFKRIADLFGYQDIMIADIKTGTVVYSVAKEDDLGTNLLDGAYANTQAAKVFRTVKQSRDPLFITFSDVELYRSSFEEVVGGTRWWSGFKAGKPTMFVGTTVFDGDDFVGALIIQLSNEQLDRLMTANRQWTEVGLGKTGETYLVGEDNTLRSSSRFFLENPKNYLDSLRRQGLPEATLQKIKAAGTPITLAPVTSKGAQNSLAGKRGTAIYRDYRGIPVVASYQPIQFGPLTWGLLAEIDEAELFSGIRRLARNLLLLAAVLIPTLTLLALWMARAFIRPIRRLQDATESVSGGNYTYVIPMAGKDEFGDLAKAFNAMSAKLGERDESLQQQIQENQRLLLSILPGSTASRLEEGSQTLAETHPHVSVLFADIEGWDNLSQQLSPAESLTLLQALNGSLGEAAKRFGMEELQEVGSSVLAVSGLSQPRIGHEEQALKAALAMLEVVQAFNRGKHVPLSLSIGIHAGPISTGVMRGERRISFDIWGQTVAIARGIHSSPRPNQVQVTTPIVEALRGRYRFRAQPPITVRGHGEVAVWVIEPEGLISGAAPAAGAAATGSPPGERSRESP
jgi:class 3 adenylate cyclase